MGERLAGDSVERPEQSWVPLAKDGSRDLSTLPPAWDLGTARKGPNRAGCRTRKLGAGPLQPAPREDDDDPKISLLCGGRAPHAPPSREEGEGKSAGESRVQD